MEQDFRSSMGWQHTWAGVVLGSVLFAIFWMGTLSVFDREIDLWMKPTTRVAPAQSAFSLEVLRPSFLKAIAAKSPIWLANLPDDREPLVTVYYRAGGSLVTTSIDPTTGVHFPDTGTLGATGFIFPFHFTLNIVLLGLGEWIVGLAAMGMLVICVSGVIIHRKIFTEFFSFRPQKKPRRMLLDLHNLSGVIGLPFHTVLAFSGLVILGVTYFPSGMKAVYPNVGVYQADVFGFSPPAGPGKEDAPVASLDAMAAQARSLWKGEGPRAVFMSGLGTTTGQVRFIRSGANEVSESGNMLTFESATGHLLPHAQSMLPAMRGQRFLAGLHLIGFHHWVLRWLYFMLGLGSCTMITTGFLFWLECRRKRQGAKFGFRLVDGLTIGSVTGIIIATLAFFIANRLLPYGVHFLGQERAALEVWAFYLVWLTTFGHGWTWPRWAWIGQSAAIGVLTCLAVLLNWITTGDHLFRTLTHRWLWPVAGMDMLLLVGGVLALFATARLFHRARAGSSARPTGKTV